VHLRNRWHRNPLEPIDHGIEPAFVRDTIVSGCKFRELLDVRARGEGVAVGAQNQHADRGVPVDAFACLGERVVHRPRDGVFGRGPIKGEIRRVIDG
jgi:hypothetical protein